MRIAIIDLLFSWPPHGGACVDVYHTANGLQALGHEVRLFAASQEGAWERGVFEPAELPFPSTRIDFSKRAFTRRAVCGRLKQAADTWGPDAVFLCEAFFLKPDLCEAFAAYPTVARYYGYEVACPKDGRLFRDNSICPESCLDDPSLCRRCALGYVRSEIKSWNLTAWSQEYLLARAYMPGYHHRLRRALQTLDAAIVYNEIQKRPLEPYVDAVHIVPGGVDLEAFPFRPLDEAGRGDKTIILMVGRAEDPAKGMEPLRLATQMLAEERDDFEVWVTHPDPSLTDGPFKAVGWHDVDGIRSLYARSDICVVPSIWQEPFGMVAVEAMATGRPVCATRVGGLQHIVVEAETGFLVEPDDAGGLADALRRLLDDGPKRVRMGEAGRRRVERDYAWNRVIEKYYPPILEGLSK